jgi:hypothetical protein
MSNLENILSEFAAFIEKSAAVMNAPIGNTVQGGSTDQSGQTPAITPQAGQPVARVNETNAISTQQSPQLAVATNKVPTSNAAPKKIDFKSFA